MKRPEDIEDMIKQELQAYSKKEVQLQDTAKEFFDPLHVLRLEATQHPDILFRNVIDRLESLGFSLLNVPVTGKLLKAPDGGFKCRFRDLK
jgi:hypothetical protein